MPLSRGHILLTTRNHWEKVGDVGVRVGEEVSFFLFSFSDLMFKKKKKKENRLLIELFGRLVNGSRSSPE
jgi:hypothetical protein